MENESVNSPKGVIKAIISDYEPNDFFCVDHMMHNGMDISRVVAYTQNPEKMSELIKNLIALLPEELEVLLRVQDDAEQSDDWTRYYAEMKREKLLSEYENNRELILHEGYNQFFVKDSVSGDYFTLDDHGALFIYSVDVKYEDLLESMQFERHAEITLFDKQHQHINREDRAELLGAMIAACGLAKV